MYMTPINAYIHRGLNFLLYGRRGICVQGTVVEIERVLSCTFCMRVWFIYVCLSLSLRDTGSVVHMNTVVVIVNLYYAKYNQYTSILFFNQLPWLVPKSPSQVSGINRSASVERAKGSGTNHGF